MPSETIDSPPFFSEELSLCDEREAGFWKSDALRNIHGTKSDGSLSPFASSPLEKRIPVNSQISNGFHHQDLYLNQDQRANPPLEKFVTRSEKAAGLSLPRGFEHNIDCVSYSTEGDKVIFMGAPYENGLFSSSLSELFSQKLRLSLNNTPYGHSVGAADSHEEEEPFESLEELEAQTIGNLLPDDDDLFSGVVDGIDFSAHLGSGDEIEEDLFCSVGGLELGEDGQMNPEATGRNSMLPLEDCNGTVGVEHPFGEQPSRTLFDRNINSNVEASELQSLFEHYGDIRTLYTACKHRGFAMISYYDMQAAQNAMKALQNKPLQHRKLDIHYAIPNDNFSDKDINQGTLVVSNLDTSVSNDELHQIFCVYGVIKEVHETRPRNHHKFVEYYDVRAAEAALHALNRSDISGIKLEPSQSGRVKRSMHPFPSELVQDESGLYLQQNSPMNLTSGSSGGPLMGPYLEHAFHNGISSSVRNSLPSLLSVVSVGSQSDSVEASNSYRQRKFEIRHTPHFHPHSLPDYHDGSAHGPIGQSPGNIAIRMGVRSSELLEPFCRISTNGHPIELDENVFKASANGSCPSPGDYMWGNSPCPQPQGVMWPNLPSFINGTCSPRPQQIHAIARAPTHLPSGLLPVNNHHVGSAPSVNPSLWERQHGYAGESADVAFFNPGSLGSMRIPGNSPHFMNRSMFSSNGGSCMELPIPSKNSQLHPQSQRCLMVPVRGHMVPMMSSFESSSERTRTCRSEANRGDNKKQFDLDIGRIMSGEDMRTTLMIKNIPNKYTSKMLLAAIDEHHRGTYDFIYLPIDFKNKCNVGYAFINMTDPSLIVSFHHAFNGKKWEKFNSEKVASLAYARIQGKSALISHFQNSSLMNEDKRCRPILFHTDGPNAGDQVPFPMV